MNLDPSVYLAIAEIAGVFVGFGALIGVAGISSGRDLNQLPALVTLGLLVILTALLPVGLSYYSIDPEWFWRICAIIFLVAIWCSTIFAMTNAGMKARTAETTRKSPLFSVGLTALELGIQGPLLLCAFAVWVDLAEAFYVTAILVNLMQASMFMVKLVFDAIVSESGSEHE
jgi:hypothetical protein